MKIIKLLLKAVLGIIIVVGLVFAVLYFMLKSPKDIGVNWTEADYASYKQKVNFGPRKPGNFNLETLAAGNFSTSGKKDVNLSFTSEEISSALSNENNEFGPIKEIKVRFLTNNEGEATFKLTDKIDQYVVRNIETLNKYPFLKNSLKDQSVYLKVKVEKSSAKSISADIEKISLGKIGLPEDVVNIVEAKAVPVINNILQNYNGLAIENLEISDGKMNYKGTVPTVFNTNVNLVK